MENILQNRVGELKIWKQIDEKKLQIVIEEKWEFCGKIVINFMI